MVFVLWQRLSLLTPRPTNECVADIYEKSRSVLSHSRGVRHPIQHPIQKTTGTTVTKARPPMAQPGSTLLGARAVSIVVGRGASSRSTFAPRTGTTTTRRTRSTTTVSASRGLRPRRSTPLNPYSLTPLNAAVRRLRAAHRQKSTRGARDLKPDGRRWRRALKRPLGQKKDRKTQPAGGPSGASPMVAHF